MNDSPPQFHALDPRVVTAWRIGGAIGTSIFSFILLAAGLSLALVQFRGTPRGVTLIGIALVLVLAWLRVLIWPSLRYRHTSYRISERSLEIRRGVIWRAEIHVPRSRVQHTDVSRGPVERGLGLATLIVYTAGTEHASIPLDGLPHARAIELRDRLLPEDADDAV